MCPACTNVWVRDLGNYRYPVEKIGECPTQYGKKDPRSNCVDVGIKRFCLMAVTNSFASAKLGCQQIGQRLAFITSEEENIAASSLVPAEKRAMLGYRKIAVEPDHVWYDQDDNVLNTATLYKNFLRYDWNVSQWDQVIVLMPDGLWLFYNNEKHHDFYMCEKTEDEEETTTEIIDQLTTPARITTTEISNCVDVGIKRFCLITVNNIFESAKLGCQQIGQRLALITSGEENIAASELLPSGMYATLGYRKIEVGPDHVWYDQDDNVLNTATLYKNFENYDWDSPYWDKVIALKHDGLWFLYSHDYTFELYMCEKTESKKYFYVIL
ncbi:hypothetical protein GQR58_010470 [Nymphon striatum]|nr:hypothetical protein GQR58_010470 [Nymphon striatum]